MEVGQPFGGKVIKTRLVSGLRLVESAYAPDFEMTMHSHEPAYFGIVLRGEYTESVGRRVWTHKPHILIFHPAGLGHTSCFNVSGAQTFRIEIERRRLDEFRGYSVLLDHPCQLNGGLSSWLVRRLYNEFNHEDSVASLAIEGLSLEILAEVARCRALSDDTRSPRWLQQVVEALHDTFGEDLSLADLAESVGVHPAHLSRVFRKCKGCSIGEYTRRLRIDFASRQLAEGVTSLVDVALEAGFFDQSHFSKTFKRLTGFTPTEFQKLSRTR